MRRQEQRDHEGRSRSHKRRRSAPACLRVGGVLSDRFRVGECDVDDINARGDCRKTTSAIPRVSHRPTRRCPPRGQPPYQGVADERLLRCMWSLRDAAGRHGPPTPESAAHLGPAEPSPVTARVGLTRHQGARSVRCWCGQSGWPQATQGELAERPAVIAGELTDLAHLTLCWCEQLQPTRTRSA